MPLSRDPDKRRRQLANLRRAPAAPAGNRRNLRHGGHAEVNVPGLDRARLELFDWLAEAAPVRDPGGGLPIADAATVELAARALARARAVDSWLQVHGFVDDRTGEVKPAAYYLERATRTADGLLSSLGMNPRERMRMGVDMARTVDLATAMSEPDDERRRALLDEAGVLGDEGDE